MKRLDGPAKKCEFGISVHRDFCLNCKEKIDKK